MRKEVSPKIIVIALGVVTIVLGYAVWLVFFPHPLPPLPPELRPGAFHAAPPAVPGQPGSK